MELRTRTYFKDQVHAAMLGPMADLDRPVYRAFPEHLASLQRLAASDETVREMCEHFDAVHTAYQRSIESNDIDSTALADEYHSLRLELEGELLERIHDEDG